MATGFVRLLSLVFYAVAFSRSVTSTASTADDEKHSNSSSLIHVESGSKRADALNVAGTSRRETMQGEQQHVKLYELFHREGSSPKTYPVIESSVENNSLPLAAKRNHTTLTQRKWTGKRKEWAFTLLTVLGICGLGMLGVSTIPLMHKVSYDRINTFLVALAIGCLTGDALLHLLPHAFESAITGGAEDKSHLRLTLSGLCAIGGMYLFLCSERATARNKMSKEKMSQERAKHDQFCDRVNMYREMGNLASEGADERLMPSEGGHCKGCEIKALCHGGTGCVAETCPELDAATCQNRQTTRKSKVSSKGMLMVVGDAMHNFVDGLAIGASFAEHVSAGICTAIAVVCHELPHEIGLFAVLLKTGMSVRLAFLANCFSSVMSIAGTICGLYIGRTWNVSPWVFALIAGVFLYLALVDMLPELTMHEHFLRLGFLLETAGFAMGLAIMTVVAYYEKDIDSLIPRKT